MAKNDKRRGIGMGTGLAIGFAIGAGIDKSKQNKDKNE